MLLAQKAIRKRLKEEVEAVAASDKASEAAKAACQEYLDTFNCGVTNGACYRQISCSIRWM